jgi:outer membrane protein
MSRLDAHSSHRARVPSQAARRVHGATLQTALILRKGSFMSLPRTALLAAIASATLHFGPAAQAQSLQALYEAARAYDAAYLAARAQAESAQYRVAQSEALLKPSAALDASASQGMSNPPNIPSLANPSGRTPLTSTTAVAATLAGRYPLINRSNAVTIDQARKSLDIAAADLQAAEQDLIVRLAQGYFDVLAAQDALATTRASKAFITEQLASAQRNFEVGTATITDTREAQARFDLVRAQEIAAENDLRTKRIALDQLVGKRGIEPRGLVTPVALPATQPADAEAWVASADAGHPTVRKARLGLEVAQLETAKARAADAPTLDAVAQLAHNQSGRGVDNLYPTTSASVGVQFRMPLYTGGSTANRIKETIALEEKSRNDVEAARRGVAQATRQAYFGLQSGQAQVGALEAAESSSKLALEATQLGYRVGVRVNLDVLNSQTQLFQTQRDLAKARYDVIVGSLRLRQAAGTLAPADVQAVNSLLAR